MSRDLIIKNLSTALGVLTLNFGHVEHAIQVLCVAVRSKQDSGQAKQDTLCGKAGQRIRGAS